MKWEYLAIPVKEHDLDKFGQIGYELVSVDNDIAYFKRPYKISHKEYLKLQKAEVNKGATND